MKIKITKKQYIVGFLAICGLLAIVRLICPSLAGEKYSDQIEESDSTSQQPVEVKQKSLAELSKPSEKLMKQTRFFNADGTLPHHPIYSVADYDISFPDSNLQQLTSARIYGVSPVANRQDAEKRKGELVYIGSNPYYELRPLNSSVPYLVPRAAVLLQDIGRIFYDSLQVKGIPLNKILITSVLRTKEDVAALRRHNGNATENSCHLYGTTFDIGYNHYTPIGRAVSNDTLKWVLSEVLNDLRKQNRCYVKHEKKQGCFHITVR